MLQRVLTLHDVADTEQLARKALDDTLRARGIRLDEHRREDLLAELVSTAWELSLKYDATAGYAFTTGCYRLLKLRVVDWLRREQGRSRWTFGPNAQHTHAGSIYTRQRPEVLSLDAPGGSELEPALGRGQRDFADDRSPDLLRVLLD
jgi:hypothetical protein